MKEKKHIREISLNDVPQMGALKYFDGEIAFADNIASATSLNSASKMNFATFVFCERGELSVRLNNIPFTIRTHDALFVAMYTVVSDIEKSDECDCKIIAIKADYAIPFVNKTIFETITQMSHNPVVHFTQDEINLMVKYYELAIFKIEHPQLNYGRETMLYLLRSFALDLLSNMASHVGKAPDDILRQGDKLFQRFVLMLASNEQNQRSVQYFADQLCVSPKYLTSICNQKCGKTASALIANSVAGRIRQLLLYSDKSIKEIAAELNFDNLSFFGKYVKKHLGDSPNSYRKKNAYGK